MTIAIQGLGKMGMQIAEKLLLDNHQVITYDLNKELLDQSVKIGAIGALNKEQLVRSFNQNKVIIWLMIPAEFVENEIREWLTILPTNSLIIDGGNSNFNFTVKSSQLIEKAGSQMLDIGTSGGIHGFANGFSMMVGTNSKDSFNLIEPILKTLAAPTGGYKYFGRAGSGHFVKMVHNAIEYGMMESLAEGYNLLKNGPYKELNLADAADVWQHHSVITSWLNELCADILKANPELDGIDGYVSESGEAKWSLQMASELNIPLPAIQAAFDVRVKSQSGQINFATKLLAAMRNSFGGHNINKQS